MNLLMSTWQHESHKQILPPAHVEADWNYDRPMSNATYLYRGTT